ncbi:MAG: DUF6350 family protein [Candidatus Nanopelagicales bacterium]
MSLTARTGAPVGQAPTAPLPLVVAGAAAGAAAAVFSYLALVVVALAAWMFDPSGSQEWTQMLEVASGAWLAGLGQAPTVAGVSLTLLPLGFALLPLIAVIAASRWAADASAVARRGEALAVALSVGVSFAAVSAIIASMSRNLGISPARTALVAGLVAGALASLVILRQARLISLDALPFPARDGLAATGAALLSLVVAASMLLTVAIIGSFDEMTSLLVELNAGVSGLLLLAVLTLGYLPIAVMWSLAYLLGPGVTVSVGTIVSPFVDTSTAALPGFPLLAALPDQPPTGAVLLPVLAVAAGVVAGSLLRRRGQIGLRGCLVAAGSAIATGATLAMAAWLASGSLGNTTLQGLGPSSIPVALAGTLLVGLGSIAVAVWPARRSDG